MSEKTLKSCRLVEQRTDIGPCIFTVEVFWYPGKGWSTHSTHTSYKDAKRALQKLVEGVKTETGTGRRIVMSWTDNGFVANEVYEDGSDE